MNKKAIILIIVGLIILVGIIYFIFIYDFSPEDKQTDQTTQTNQPATPVVSKSSPSTVTQATNEVRDEKAQSRDEASRLAMYFAERYGSSSSQADFQNLVDLEVFMTDKLKIETQKYIATERQKAVAKDYESIVTRAIVVEFNNFNETTGTAEGVVKTKRRQTKTDGSINDFEQNLVINLKKVDKQWKVDSASWK